MPRGADYDDGVSRSDNAIDPNHNVMHGVGPNVSQDYLTCTSFLHAQLAKMINKAAPLPEGMSEMDEHHRHSGMGTRGHPESSSGKGGHEPKTLGEREGLGGPKSSKKADVVAP
jgi:hypothetical protein